MPSNVLRVTTFLVLVLGARSTYIGAQDAPTIREQAVTGALLFVRGNASEELRTVLAADITLDASRLPNVPQSPSDSELAMLSSQLRAHVVRALDTKCAQAGDSLTKVRALFARAWCVTESSRYYVETELLEFGADTAIVMVHVFRRPTNPDRPHVSRIDYAGYKVELLRRGNTWVKPRLISIVET